MEIGDVIMDAVRDILRERLGDKAIRRVDSKPVRKRLSKRIFELVFYELLTTGMVKLPPGMGSLRTTGVKKKIAKVYDKRRKIMVERPTSTRKILYRPGDTIREFL
jgi:hypothetical protein